MRVRTSSDLATVVREARLAQDIRQAGLAEKIGASRAWIIRLEQGRERLEFGLVLKALHALGVEMRVSFGQLMSAEPSGWLEDDGDPDW